MTEDFDLVLFDRLNVIKDTIQKYGEENFFISFSGGKDSTILHYLVDMAIPENKIPRVYSNTGIEYKKNVEFVKGLAAQDDRFVILNPSVKIKKTLDEHGYPFKSKEYSQWYKVFKNNEQETRKVFKQIEDNPELLKDYDFIHNLPKGTKWTIKYIYGLRERERAISTSMVLSPNILKYQFLDENFNLNISDQCCKKIKEEPVTNWQKENNKTNVILGLRKEEGGRRESVKCVAFKDKGISFSPLAIVSNDWQKWFINKYNIRLSDLYYPPYSFERTGCIGCPYNINLNRELETLRLYLTDEYNQANILWKPIYDEYRRIGYRLKKEEQIKIL